MSNQYTKLTGHNSTKESQVMNRRRPARESQPPMMSNQSMFDKTPTTTVQTIKQKQSQVFESLNRANNKYNVESNELEKQVNVYKSGIGFKTNESNNVRKQQQSQNINNQQQGVRQVTSSRFMSPQLKNITSSGFHKPQQRKYSSQISQVNYGSRSIQQLPSPNDITYHRSNTTGQNTNISVNQGKSQAQQSNNQSAPMLVKKAPRFSEPANFTMDNWQQPNETESPLNNSTSSSEAKKATTRKQSTTTVAKQSVKTVHTPVGMTKINSFTPTAFKKDKELKETVSTQSTFHPIGETTKSLMRLQPKINQQSKKAPQQLKLADFVIGKEIGSGKFGSVYIVKHKLIGFVCALKKIPKEIIKEENILNQLTRELKIQMFLDHPNIIKLYSFFHDEDNIYLLLELGSSGQLYKVIKEKERMTEASTSYTIKQVCEAIRYLHYYNIIHRDLKPQNIVIQSGTVKLCDFGWAVCKGTGLRSTFCGTPLYVSPQILKGQQYDQKIDLWAIGILTYQLLFGNIPFEINREEELIKIIKEDIVFPANIPVSAEAKDFVLRILKKNPGERLDIGELLKHEFLKKCPEMAPELENC